MQIRLRLLDIMDLLFYFQESTFWNLVIFFQLKPVLGSYISKTTACISSLNRPI